MSIEAMKQALEALENHNGNYKLSKAECAEVNKVCDNLRQAIAEAEKQERYSSAELEKAKAWAEETAALLNVAEKQEPVAVYGYCPVCHAPGTIRERRPNGNDRCSNGHIYASKDAIHPPQRSEDSKQPKAEQEPKREWIELTDEEIEDCYKQGGIGRASQILKEKNT